MPNNEILKYCIDKVLPRDIIINAAEIAITENPTNQPDIRFSPGLGIAEFSRLELAALTAKKWQQERVLSVAFLDGDADVQEKVKKYAHKWSPYTNITFKFVDNANADIRISFEFDPGRSWSYLGTDSLSIDKNEPTMNFGWLTPNSAEDEFSRVVAHEFGHALGCIHEHQNPDTDIPWNKEKVYKLYKQTNGWDKETVDRNIFQKYSKDITQYSSFDKESIMLYSIPKTLTDGSFEVGWNRKLSDTDKSFIGVMYPKKAKPYIELVVDAKPIQESIGKHGEEDSYKFSVDDGGTYRVETAGWTDLVLTLFGPDTEDKKIGFDDDSGFLWNARIDADLVLGTYYIRVRHFKPRRTGKYRISVKPIK
jgi:hypothetical protein